MYYYILRRLFFEIHVTGTTQAIKRSNQWLFVVTVGLHIQSGRQFQGTRQCAAGDSLEHVFLRWQRL
jgi:hypothetical protein